MVSFITLFNHWQILINIRALQRSPALKGREYVFLKICAEDMQFNLGSWMWAIFILVYVIVPDLILKENQKSSKWTFM